ncbi:MAG: hypothetical protein ACEQR8_00850 [Cypionkella sp.]
MFEAAILPAVAGPGESLRPLDWRELVARFAAVRDLRGLGARPAAGAASFAAGAAQLRAASGERGINLDALERGKAPTAISFAAAGEAAVGDQGTR